MVSCGDGFRYADTTLKLFNCATYDLGRDFRANQPAFAL